MLKSHTPVPMPETCAGLLRKRVGGGTLGFVGAILTELVCQIDLFALSKLNTCI